MAKRKETPKKTIPKIFTSEEQLEKSRQLVAEELGANPDIFVLPESKRTAGDIENFFLKITSDEVTLKLLPKEKLRYVMYLRKSTKDEDKQVRSLEDQEIECKELCRQLGITVREEDIIAESASARHSGNRPLFEDMVRGFKNGKYHGLIAWSPDRLSRNMKDAGEIIEMLDDHEIQELHFKTQAFENNASGKMLLGILFATSKQYSDSLSVNVTRGIKGNAEDGKYNGSIKRGYYVDSQTRYFMPDAHNWQLLRLAVNMRLREGKTNKEVAEFLNAAHFSGRSFETEDHQILKMTKKNVGETFADPFYCGVYKLGNTLSNLNELYNFIPLITPDEFISLNRVVANDFSEAFVGRSSSSKRLDFGILRDKVICDFCGEKMAFQRTKIKKGKNAGCWLLSFYCRNKDCIRHHDKEAIEKFGHKLSKSIRLKYLSAHIAWTIRHLTKNTLQAHQEYIDTLKKKLAVDREITKRKLASARAEVRKQKDLFEKHLQLQLLNPAEFQKHYSGRLEFHQNLMNQNQASVETLEKELLKLNSGLPTYEEFVELIHSYLKTIIETTDILEEDAVYQELVLNLRAGDNCVSVINLNPPYNLMADLDKISCGGRIGSVNEPDVLEKLYQLLSNYAIFKARLSRTRAMIKGIKRSESFAELRFLI